MSIVANKYILITGGADGLGFAMVNELLRNEASAVAIVDISKDNGEKALQSIKTTFGEGKAIFIEADVTQKAQFEDAFQTTVNKFKQLDIVINNAAILDEYDPERTLNTNLGAVIQGTFLAMQKYLPKYKSGQEGIIVNIASIGGLKPFEMSPVYSSAKAGVVSLGRSLSGDEYYKRFKSRIVTLCPGAFNTAMYRSTEEKVVLKSLFRDEIDKIAPNVKSPEFVGKAIIQVIENGKNGSIWVVEGDNSPYEVTIPDLLRR